MISQNTSDKLIGSRIKEIFKSAETVADLHGCITSPRGNNFRLQLLQAAGVSLSEEAIEQLRAASGINEYRRHLNMLLKFGLLQVEEDEAGRFYIRTDLGEKGVNALREMERRIGKEAADVIYETSLGPNSIRLFLRVYGNKREADWDQLQLRYTPAEIGRLSIFLPRVIEEISAIDRLNEADLLVYRDDGYVYMQPTKARGFYKYLQTLLEIVTSNPE